MTIDETIDLLTVAAAYDLRKVGETDAIAWHAAVGDLDFGDCRAAVVGHYQETRDRLMPADVRRRVKAMRRDRLERHPIPAPAPELTDRPSVYREALKGNLKRTADGFSISRAIGELPSATPPSVAEVRRALGPVIPPPERHLPPEEIARRQVAEARAARGASVIPGTVISDEGEPAA